MALPGKEQIAEIVNKIQNDPELSKEFLENPIKVIEEVGNINIPDFLEGKIESIISEYIDSGDDRDPMEIVNNFIK